MGADPHDPNTGEVPACETGNDVLDQLNEVFGNPKSDKYRKARDNNNFGTVPNAAKNYNALIDAYVHAGLNVNGRWRAYLRALGTVPVDPKQGPQNIYDIAQFRDRNLKKNQGMSTITHTPHHGGHVHTKPGGGIDPEIVDSPFPLPAD